MLEVIVSFVAFIALCALPTLLIARVLNAENAALGPSVLALFFHCFLAKFIFQFVPSFWLSIALIAVSTAFTYQISLSTSYTKGLVITTVSSLMFTTAIGLFVSTYGNHITIQGKRMEVSSLFGKQFLGPKPSLTDQNTEPTAQPSQPVLAWPTAPLTPASPDNTNPWE